MRYEQAVGLTCSCHPGRAAFTPVCDPAFDATKMVKPHSVVYAKEIQGATSRPRLTAITQRLCVHLHNVTHHRHVMHLHHVTPLSPVSSMSASGVCMRSVSIGRPSSQHHISAHSLPVNCASCSKAEHDQWKGSADWVHLSLSFK